MIQRIINLDCLPIKCISLINNVSSWFEISVSTLKRFKTHFSTLHHTSIIVKPWATIKISITDTSKKWRSWSSNTCLSQKRRIMPSHTPEKYLTNILKGVKIWWCMYVVVAPFNAGFLLQGRGNDDLWSRSNQFSLMNCCESA